MCDTPSGCGVAGVCVAVVANAGSYRVRVGLHIAVVCGGIIVPMACVIHRMVAAMRGRNYRMCLRRMYVPMRCKLSCLCRRELSCIVVCVVANCQRCGWCREYSCRFSEWLCLRMSVALRILQCAWVFVWRCGIVGMHDECGAECGCCGNGSVGMLYCIETTIR